MKRRSFLQSLFKAAAIVALAPQLAFRSRPVIPKIVHPPKLIEFWYQTTRASHCYDEAYSVLMNKLCKQMDHE